MSGNFFIIHSALEPVAIPYALKITHYSTYISLALLHFALTLRGANEAQRSLHPYERLVRFSIFMTFAI
jgi:hypothetical protein